MNRNTTETIQDNEAMLSDKFERLRHTLYVGYDIRDGGRGIHQTAKPGESCWSRRTDCGTLRIRNRKLSASTHQFYVDCVFTTRTGA